MKPNTRKSPLVAVAFAAVALAATIPAAGVKALDRRLDGAVWQLCGSPGFSMGGVPPAAARCRRMAEASITPQRRIAIARAAGEHLGTFASARNTAGAQPVVILAE